MVERGKAPVLGQTWKGEGGEKVHRHHDGKHPALARGSVRYSTGMSHLDMASPRIQKRGAAGPTSETDGSVDFTQRSAEARDLVCRAMLKGLRLRTSTQKCVRMLFSVAEFA